MKPFPCTPPKGKKRYRIVARAMQYALADIYAATKKEALQLAHKIHEGAFHYGDENDEWRILEAVETPLDDEFIEPLPESEYLR